MAYFSIGEAAARAGNAAMNEKAIELAKKAAGGLGSYPWREFASRWVARAQARAGQVEGVKARVEGLKDPEEVVAVCLGAVEGLLPEEDSRAGLDTSR
jgi:hypothetical protein